MSSKSALGSRRSHRVPLWVHDFPGINCTFAVELDQHFRALNRAALLPGFDPAQIPGINPGQRRDLLKGQAPAFAQGPKRTLGF